YTGNRSAKRCGARSARVRATARIAADASTRGARSKLGDPARRGRGQPASAADHGWLRHASAQAVLLAAQWTLALAPRAATRREPRTAETDLRGRRASTRALVARLAELVAPSERHRPARESGHCGRDPARAAAHPPARLDRPHPRAAFRPPRDRRARIVGCDGARIRTAT